MNGERIHKALGTADWQKAQQIVRELETGANCTDIRTQVGTITLNQAWLRFMADLGARKLHPATVRKYRLLQKQMEEFATHKGTRFLGPLDIDTMGEFRSGWKDGALSASKKLERLKAFFCFAMKRRWITESPVSDLKAPKVSLKPTMPFTHEEMCRILEAVDIYCRETSANGRENARRLRAFVLLLRYSGMRISDVVNLTADRFVRNRLFLYTQKTGVPVHIVIPEFVLRVLESTPPKSENHFFWSGVGKLESIVRSWQTRLRRLFQLAGVARGQVKTIDSDCQPSLTRGDQAAPFRTGNQCVNRCVDCNQPPCLSGGVWTITSIEHMLVRILGCCLSPVKRFKMVRQ